MTGKAKLSYGTQQYSHYDIKLVKIIDHRWRNRRISRDKYTKIEIDTKKDR